MARLLLNVFPMAARPLWIHLTRRFGTLRLNAVSTPARGTIESARMIDWDDPPPASQRAEALDWDEAEDDA